MRSFLRVAWNVSQTALGDRCGWPGWLLGRRTYCLLSGGSIRSRPGSRDATSAPWASERVRMVGCVTSVARSRDPADANTRNGTGQLDAVLLAPLLAVLITAGDGHSVALLNGEADTQRARTVSLPGRGPKVATSFDNHGRRWRVTVSTGLDHQCGVARRRICHCATLGSHWGAGDEPPRTST